MTKHIQNVHSEKIYPFEKCNYRGGSLPQINNHKKKSHNLEKGTFECDQCNIKCSRLETLKLRKLSKHEERSHSCTHCDFKTYTQHNTSKDQAQ